MLTGSVRNFRTEICDQGYIYIQGGVSSNWGSVGLEADRYDGGLDIANALP